MAKMEKRFANEVLPRDLMTAEIKKTNGKRQYALCLVRYDSSW